MPTNLRVNNYFHGLLIKSTAKSRYIASEKRVTLFNYCDLISEQIPIQFECNTNIMVYMYEYDRSDVL